MQKQNPEHKLENNPIKLEPWKQNRTNKTVKTIPWQQTVKPKPWNENLADKTLRTKPCNENMKANQWKQNSETIPWPQT